MNEIDDGYFFWKRVDSVRPKHVTLKQIVDEAQLNYHLVKVQRSCNRIPKALEAAKLANALHVSLEWLLTGKIMEMDYHYDSDDIMKRRQAGRIVQVLLTCDPSKWSSVEHALGMKPQLER